MSQGAFLESTPAQPACCSAPAHPMNGSGHLAHYLLLLGRAVQKRPPNPRWPCGRARNGEPFTLYVITKDPQTRKPTKKLFHTAVSNFIFGYTSMSFHPHSVRFLRLWGLTCGSQIIQCPSCPSRRSAFTFDRSPSDSISPDSRALTLPSSADPREHRISSSYCIPCHGAEHPVARRAHARLRPEAHRQGQGDPLELGGGESVGVPGPQRPRVHHGGWGRRGGSGAAGRPWVARRRP